jgi:hypothetical protein
MRNSQRFLVFALHSTCLNMRKSKALSGAGEGAEDTMPAHGAEEQYEPRSASTKEGA